MENTRVQFLSSLLTPCALNTLRTADSKHQNPINAFVFQYRESVIFESTQALFEASLTAKSFSRTSVFIQIKSMVNYIKQKVRTKGACHLSEVAGRIS